MPAVDPYPGCEPGACAAPWASERIVMVGQAPSARGSTEPRHALTGRPMRFLFDVAGIGLMEYIRTFERHNLVREWRGYRRAGCAASGSALPVADAVVGAQALLARAAGRRLLCWGTEVAGVFRRAGAAVPKDMPALTWCPLTAGGLTLEMAVLPHPSGLNRWWNAPANRVEAGAFLCDAVDRVSQAKRLETPAARSAP